MEKEIDDLSELIKMVGSNSGVLYNYALTIWFNRKLSISYIYCIISSGVSFLFFSISKGFFYHLKVPDMIHNIIPPIFFQPHSDFGTKS